MAEGKSAKLKGPQTTKPGTKSTKVRVVRVKGRQRMMTREQIDAMYVSGFDDGYQFGERSGLAQAENAVAELRATRQPESVKGQYDAPR